MKKENGNIKIVFIGRYNESETLTGPEKAAKRIFNEHSARHETVFIQYFFDGSRYGFIKKLFGREETDFNNSKIYTLGLFKIIPLLIKLKPEIIHFINFERFGIIAMLYKIFTGSKAIYNSHGIIAFENNELKTVSRFYRIRDKFCEKIYFKFSDKIIFMSGNQIEIAEKYFKIVDNKCVILFNGIDKQFNSVQRKNEGTLKAVYITGAELRESGMRFLKNALPALKNRMELFIIGSIIDSSMDSLNRNVKIHFINKMNTEKFAAFYEDKDIFLSLNDYETFSISSAEAMAAGLVTIVTSNTGMSRYITSGENGYIIEYGQINELSGIIENLFENSALKEQISAESAKIYEMLSWENVYVCYMNLYLSVLK